MSEAQPTRGIAGVLFVVFGLLAFAIQDSIVRRLTETYSVLETLTWRTFLVLFVLIAVCGLSKERRLLRTQRPGILMIRGVFAFSAFSLYYLALSKMAFADGAAIYMSAPLWVTVLSIPLLGERVGIHRAAALLIGFGAAIYMINPGSDVFSAVAVLPLISAVIYAFIPIINRRVGLREHALTMALYAIMGYAIMCTIAGIAINTLGIQIDPQSLFANFARPWTTPSLPDLLWMFASGLIFIVGLLGLTQAYRTLPVSIVAPFEYSYLVWAGLLGFLVFDEIPGIRTLIGAIIIVGCGCYVGYRERNVGRDSAD